MTLDRIVVVAMLLAAAAAAVKGLYSVAALVLACTGGEILIIRWLRRRYGEG